MYTINHLETENILEIQNSNLSCYAKIHLRKGASLQELTLDNHAIMVDLNPLVYADTYASAILFPFANRVKDGAYNFNKKHYKLPTNNKAEQNALHGLVYNKAFKIVDFSIKEQEVLVKLEYNENECSIGFPFPYVIQLEYVFTEKKMSLNVLVKNTGTEPFPFTLGWHPYFLSDNLYASALEFSSCEKILIGERNIATGVKTIQPTKVFKVEDKKLDDCWKLETNKVKFKTPNYQFLLESSETNNFLQLYTPPKENVIAIEPTTGVSNSFNNQIGLKVLKPKELYNIQWQLTII